jgi:hypothetical protein
MNNTTETPITTGIKVNVYGWKSAGFALFSGTVVKITPTLVFVETANGRTFAGSAATVEAKS